MAKEKGKLIVIEGTDCSGKQTQTELLINRLKEEGINCIKMSFPDYSSPTGKIVGGPYLGKPEICGSFFENPAKEDAKVISHYYAADRLYARPKIIKHLEDGVTVILDRYVESNMGHQGGKIEDSNERIEFFKWLNALEYGLNELPKPDKVLFLFMPYLVGMELKKGREGAADEHEKSPDHLRMAQDSYLQLVDLYNWNKIDCTKNGTYESIKTREEIAEEIWNKVKELI